MVAGLEGFRGRNPPASLKPWLVDETTDLLEVARVSGGEIPRPH